MLEIWFDLNFSQNHVEIDKRLETSLFRIFQEAVTNILRHANASKVRVCMSYANKNLTFTIEDNGIGIRKEDLASSESLGLIGIKERVYPWNGQVNFEGSPGKGTIVTITIPFKQKWTPLKNFPSKYW